ncbi:hypothetical protein [Saccharothrix texasensis]|uniref:Uncharacterized protein n=1 Tax=Saccharothrix texasensis TaxID=103734 RepID=A0A3N1H4J7_9PSEU|nr:hypothetical protein [Saccharothrix texasensis]ROP37435.1 hypothetical protein EDD40_2748 [Saccharothrix texasensis]
MSLAKLKNNDQVHAYAVYRAAAEAMAQTGVTVEVKSEPGRYRLKVASRLVQVISRRSGDWQIKDAYKPLAPDTDVVIFVDLEGEEPTYYPVPGDWFRHDLAKRYAAYMAKVGERRQNPDTHHYAVKDSYVVRWESRWDVLTG